MTRFFHFSQLGTSSVFPSLGAPVKAPDPVVRILPGIRKSIFPINVNLGAKFGKKNKIYIRMRKK